MKAKRLVFPEKERCEVEEYDVAPPAAGEVLVKNRLSLISAGTELAMFTGIHRGFSVPEFSYARYPFRPGYAAVGEVLEVGEGVDDIRPGDVVLHTGKHATVAVVKRSQVPLGRLPEGLSPEEAPMVIMAGVALSAVRVARPEVGDFVLVIGLGVVGNLAVQVYRASGGWPVGGCDLYARRLQVALECGADFAWDTSGRPLAEYLEEFGRKPDIVVEAVGLNPTIRMALDAVADDGTVVLLGSPRSKFELDPYFDIHRRRVRMVGAYGNLRDEDLPMLAGWFASGRMKARPMITDRMPFERAGEAYRMLLDEPARHMAVLLTYD